MSSGLRQRYDDEVVQALTKEFSYGNPMQVPRLSKIVVNIGLGEALTNSKAVEFAADRRSRGKTSPIAVLTGSLTVTIRCRIPAMASSPT